MDTAGHINPGPSCVGTRWAPAGRASCWLGPDGWCSSRPRGCSRQQKLKVTATRHSRVGMLRIRPGGGSCHRHQHSPGRPPPGPALPSACPPELLTSKHLLSAAPASSADGAARGAGSRAATGRGRPPRLSKVGQLRGAAAQPGLVLPSSQAPSPPCRQARPLGSISSLVKWGHNSSPGTSTCGTPRQCPLLLRLPGQAGGN